MAPVPVDVGVEHRVHRRHRGDAPDAVGAHPAVADDPQAPGGGVVLALGEDVDVPVDEAPHQLGPDQPRRPAAVGEDGDAPGVGHGGDQEDSEEDGEYGEAAHLTAQTRTSWI